jgi:hypothetical protein
MEVNNREVQGRYFGIGLEGSVDQKYEPTNSNWIITPALQTKF